MPPTAAPVRVLKAITLTVVCLLVLIPFLGVLSTSVASREAVTKAGGIAAILFGPGLPGRPGYQQHIWQATLGPRAVGLHEPPGQRRLHCAA